MGTIQRTHKINASRISISLAAIVRVRGHSRLLRTFQQVPGLPCNRSLTVGEDRAPARSACSETSMFIPPAIPSTDSLCDPYCRLCPSLSSAIRRKRRKEVT
jgi:hypothetical protein